MATVKADSTGRRNTVFPRRRQDLVQRLRGRHARPGVEGAGTVARSVAPRAARSVPFGKYRRERPFVFSFEPRCHGL